MPPIDINPKYHPMPEKPGSFSCPQCGQIIVEIVSGKCQNCGRLFDQRQLGGQRDESRSLRYNTTSRTQKEKPIQAMGKPSSVAQDTTVKHICPQCKNNINDTDVIDKKCPFCGYMGLMTSRQMDVPGQDPNISQDLTNLRPAEPTIPEPPQQSQVSVPEMIPGSDSSSSIDVAPKDWKLVESGSKVDKTPRSKTTDKSKEWAGESKNRLSFAPLLQSIRDFPFNRIVRITGALLITALVVFGAIKIIPIIFPSQSSSTGPPIGTTVTKISIVDVANNDITHSSATLTWTTNKQASRKVEYGTNRTYNDVASSDDLAENHSIMLTSLDPNTSYFYKITSIDEDGNEAIYESIQPFTTKMLPDTIPPAISSVIVTPSKITDKSAVISWEIDDAAADSFVEYGKTEKYGENKASKKDSANIRTAILSGLEPSATYYFRIVSQDIAGNEAIHDTEGPFITLAPIPTGTKVGDHAPDFNLEYFTIENLPQEYLIDGNNAKLSDFRGKVVIVNFWSISCSACIAEMPHIQQVYENSNMNEVVVLAVHTKQYRSRIERYFEKADWSLPVLLDTNGETSRDYKITRIPRTFFIDAEGIIQKVKLGRFNNPSEIEAILEDESLLGSKP